MNSFPDHSSSIPQRVVRALWRGWRLCCPRCGERTLFVHWFKMHERCAVCRLRFERAQGYFVGAMYINYAFTVAIVLSGYFVLEWLTDLSLTYQLIIWVSVSLLCPLYLFPRSRGVWLNVDHLINPELDTGSSEDQESPHEK